VQGKQENTKIWFQGIDTIIIRYDIFIVPKVPGGQLRIIKRQTGMLFPPVVPGALTRNP
jgi:hypothetical protein